jgi:hypothetical protein
MANSKRNSLRKSRITENRNQRQTEPVQPGANAHATQGVTPEEAQKAARGTLGKTSKHTSITE